MVEKQVFTMPNSSNSSGSERDGGIVVSIRGEEYDLGELPGELKLRLLALLQQKKQPYEKPPLDSIFNLADFTDVARNTLSENTWSYYRTGAADEITLRENTQAWRRIYFRPRILNNVTEVSLATELLGSKSAYPFYITAFAGCHLDNNVDAEKPLLRASDESGGVYMLPFQTTLGITQLSNEGEGDQWLQIYVGQDRQRTKEVIKEAEATGKIKALCFTVDMAQIGRRETHQRVTGDGSFVKHFSGISSSFSWAEVRGYKDSTHLKCVLKGIQSKEDALKAIEYGFDGIILSNHGGRQLDTARSGIEVLAEVHRELKLKGLEDRIEIFVDGGVSRGSDVVKALALGAKGVGLGRAMLYALQSYGEPGVAKAIDILRSEVELTLRLLGVRSIGDLDESYVDITNLALNRATH